MSIEDVQNVTVKKTIIKGDKKLVDSHTKKTTTGSIMVSDETKTTVSEHKGDIEVVIFPKKENAVKENGEITFSKDLSDEQIENLKKLKDAQDFMNTDEGKKLAQSLQEQSIDISKGQRKWLKKQGIDADAYIQEWNRQNPDNPNNKKYLKETADNARDNMGAYAKGFLGNEEVKSNKPKQENLGFVKGLFKKQEKEVVKDDQKYSQHGVKIKHHSSTEAERNASIKDDVTDEIAREGDKFLNSFNNDKGSRRKTFKEIDENGNEVKFKVKYDKDGNAKKVTVKSDASGKLKVKRESDGDITVKGNLQAEYAYEDAPAITEINNTRVQKFKETETITNDNTYLKKDTVIIEKREHCPDPQIDISYKDLRGEYISDMQARDKEYTGKDGKKHVAVSGDTIRDIADKKGVDYLIKGYCGNPAIAKYEAATESFRGNLNQQNAKFMTGCFIHANDVITRNGYGGKEINEKTADYDRLNEMINAAYARDQEVINIAGPNAANQILPFIKLEIDEHNRDCKKGPRAPRTNNEPIDMSKLPEWFQKMPNAVQKSVK